MTPSSLLYSFASVLRDSRIHSGLSQKQLANEGLNRAHVSALEGGEVDPKLTTLWRIAQTLGVPLSVLIRNIERNYYGESEGCPMTPQEKEQLFEALNRIQYQPEVIFIRQDDGRNVALSELPTLMALQYVCEWLRKRIERL